MALGLGRALAVALAEHGCVSLRYDKRGVGASAGDYLSTGFHDECDDAAATLAALRTHPAWTPDGSRRRALERSRSAAGLVRSASPPAGYVLLAGAAKPASG